MGKGDDYFYGTELNQRTFVNGSEILKPMKGHKQGRDWRSMNGSRKETGKKGQVECFRSIKCKLRVIMECDNRPEYVCSND